MAKEMSRKWLEAMSLDADKIDAIVEAHSNIVQAIIQERDGYKTELDSVKEKMVDKAELTKVKKELDDLKTAQQKKTEREAKETALKSVYKDAGIADKFIPLLIRVAEFDKLELDGDNLKNRKELVEQAKKDFAEFVPTVQESNGQQTATPPSGGKVKMTKEQILAIKDTGERQKAIAENLDTFGY